MTKSFSVAKIILIVGAVLIALRLVAYWWQYSDVIPMIQITWLLTIFVATALFLKLLEKIEQMPIIRQWDNEIHIGRKRALTEKLRLVLTWDPRKDPRCQHIQAEACRVRTRR